ncbi:mitochondrial 3-ketoacyl-CoA thiolase [Chytridium lagenaria]|nr:mitochondrial 3-ketoacyl-CoA thiolase [Chytridium lagenaria]
MSVRAATKNVYIVAAKRTPFGAFNGKLAHLTATELGGIASVAAAKTLPANTPIDSVIYGNVIQTSSDAAYLARHVGHRTGLPIHVSALTDIATGEAEIVLAGGTENMSQAPYALRGIRAGTRYGVDQKLEDTLAHGLVDQYPTVTPMGITAENLAKQYNITRKDADEYALLTQQRWAAGWDLQRRNHPYELKSRKGVEVFAHDEHARPNTTIESLTKLPSVNASGISDAVKKHNLSPLARIVSWNYVGVEPTIMGIGPAPAIRSALKRAGLTLNDMDLVEVNEAFAVQFLAVQKELGLDMAKTNVNGGAIALGHPLGASGARILAHLTHALRRINGKYAVGSACIGGGQGIAVVLEKC